MYSAEKYQAEAQQAKASAAAEEARLAKLLVDAGGFLDNVSVVFVVGGPSVGKHTQCQLAAEEFRVEVIRPEALLMQEMSDGTEYGDVVRDMMRSGKLVPVEITLGLVKAHMLRSPHRHFVLEGFPKTLDEVRAAHLAGTGRGRPQAQRLGPVCGTMMCRRRYAAPGQMETVGRCSGGALGRWSCVGDEKGVGVNWFGGLNALLHANHQGRRILSARGRL